MSGARATASLVLLAAWAGACGPIHKTAVEHGEDLFREPALGSAKNAFSCSTCHAGASPPAGLLSGAPMRGVTRRPSYWGGSELDLLRSINHCVVDLMESDAPLSAASDEALALWAFLDSLSQTDEGAGAVPFTVPAVPVDPGPGSGGEKVFRDACQGCHGELHSGQGRLTTSAPILPEDTLAQHPSPEYTDAERRYVFVQKTRYGSYYGYGGTMPPFSLEVLPDDALADLLASLGL